MLETLCFYLKLGKYESGFRVNGPGRYFNVTFLNASTQTEPRLLLNFALGIRQTGIIDRC